MNVKQLARATRFLANDGIDPRVGKTVVTPEDARRINALMLMSGTYDAAGAFAFEIGIPCKSGVGGGIVGIIPGFVSLCVWSPGLDKTGNSLAGRMALAAFMEKSGLSVF
jgi:glutaminase